MEKMKLEKLAELFEEASSSKYGASELMKVNGDFIEFMDPNTLKQDPAFTAELILSAEYGHPCEALRRAINDNYFLIEVAKCIVQKDRDSFQWVIEHMFSHNEKVQEYLSKYISEHSFDEKKHSNR